MPKYLYGFSSRDGAKRRRIQSRSEDSDFDSDPYFLRGLRIYILPSGLGNSRRKVLQNLVKKHGGTIVHSVNDSTSHVLVDETISSAMVCRSLGWNTFPPQIRVVMVGWLSASIRANSCIDISEYEIPCVNKTNPKDVCTSSHRRNGNVISVRTDTLAENGFHPEGSVSDNADIEEVTTEEVKEEESTFDDGVYEGETTCDDEWLLNAVPEPLMYGLINSFKKGTANTDPVETESSGPNYCNVLKLKSVKHFGEPNSDSRNISNNNSAGQHDLNNLNQSKSVAKSNTDIIVTSEVPVLQHTFCSEASQRTCSEELCKSSYSSQNPNSFVVNKLQMMYEYFKRNGDKWRVHAYEKAIIALRTYPKPVTTYEEAASLNGMSKNIARKILRWIKTGDYSEVDIMCSKERALVMKIFTRAWGIGSKLAAELYKQGHRTILDLRANSDLSREQLVGLRYFDDLKTRMPREEATRILSTVLSRIFDLYSYVQCDACSSLRRNKKYCGHVNILVTLPEGVTNNHKLLPEIVARLHQEGFLIDDLLRHEENGNQTHYSGVFKFKFEGAKHRRLDITVCSRDEYACALLYLTGSAYFNRAIRQIALKKNMILDEHSLRVKTHSTVSSCDPSSLKPVISEEIIHTPSESAIFTHLGLPFRSPELRDRSNFFL